MLIADFHIHSKYSRACSKDLTLPNIAAACERKGIDLVATGDFTHPAWMKHIEEELEEVGHGIYILSGDRSRTKFILVTEISSIYSQGGKVRRVHSLVFAPTIACARAFNAALEARGCNLKSDGRPIIGLSAQELLRVALSVSPEMMLVPAHAWTPWFSVFGSKSGFDSLEECFGDLTPHVRAIETGLSSDPAMNWRLSALDGITLISNSDAHSVEKLGREATVFDLEQSANFSYTDIVGAIAQKKTAPRVSETIEFFPEEGKYHIDGHAACNFSCEPSETKKLNGVCPRCGKSLTIGVLYRVDALADVAHDKVIHSQHTPFRSIIPLVELIAFVEDVGVNSKKVRAIYDALIEKIGSEFFILLDAPLEKIRDVAGDEVASAVQSMRLNNVKLTPGYDGVFGKIEVMRRPRAAQQAML